MTQSHIEARNRRIRARRGTDTIWYLIAGLLGAVLLMTAFGLMNWNPQVAVPHTSVPVDVQQAVQSGGLTVK